MTFGVERFFFAKGKDGFSGMGEKKPFQASWALVRKKGKKEKNEKDGQKPLKFVILRITISREGAYVICDFR